MENNEKVYHIIDSIKGGCGKTTFSIMLTEYLSRKIEKNTDNEKDQVCLLDMDFLGTGLFNLFYDNIGKDDNFEKVRKDFLVSNCFINDKIRGGSDVFGKKYIVDIEVEGKKFFIAFGNPGYDAKETYLQAIKNTSAMGLNFATIRAGLKKVLKDEELKKQFPNNPRHIVVDLAPCNDSYSQAVKDIFFDRTESNYIIKESKINYYLMSGMDSSHLYNTYSYLVNMLKRDGKLANNYYIVFNDIAGKVADKNAYDSRINNIFKRLKSNLGYCPDNIHFLVLNYYAEYQKFLMNLEPLNDAGKSATPSSSSIFSSNPFRYCAMLDDKGNIIVKPILEDTEKEVLKWLI